MTTAQPDQQAPRRLWHERAQVGSPLPLVIPSDQLASRREAAPRRRPTRPSSKSTRLALAGLLGLVAIAVAVAAAVGSTLVIYLAYIGVSLVLGAIAATTLAWMLHAWWTPEALTASSFAADPLEPAHSFSLIVPARHEEAVLEATLLRLARSDHPAFEVIVVVGEDDPGTQQAAERVEARYPDLFRIVVDESRPKNKPKALNAALRYCTGTITGVFDAEDDVHPALLRRVDQCFQKTDADIVQAGVQLMNFRSSCLAVRNVLEYYFWFRSRLHLHARQRFIPLGGNTAFIRTEVLRAVDGWDPECLAEDCELGVRLSSLGAQTAVFYEPELVTREECPTTIGAFVRQRTRWNQGYLQTLSRGYWRRLPLPQRALGVYILVMPYLMAVAWLLIPVAITTAFLVSTPVPITLISFIPALPVLSTLVAEIAGLAEFARAYGERATIRDYAGLVIGLPLYQLALTFASARAVVREIRGARGWEKTAHIGLHLVQTGTAQPPRSRPAAGVPPRRIRRRQPLAVGVRATGEARSVVLASSQAAPNGGVTDSDAIRAVRRPPLWARLVAASENGSSSPPGPALLDAVPADGSAALQPETVPIGLWAGGHWLRHLRALVRRAVAGRIDLVVLVALLAGVGVIMATNALHWPAAQFDEGTYIGNAWAVQHGRLAPYTYSYGHPPLAWLLIFLWTWTIGIFGHAGFSIDSGREFMVLVSLVSCSLLYTLARRLDFGRPFAAGAVLLFALSPVAIFFHRAVLLDNPSIALALAAFVLARTRQRRLSAFAGSGACFAASMLCKETTFVLLPALLIMAAQNSDRRNRRYCLALFISFLVLIGLSYPLYAALKGELLPGHGHVSLIGYAIIQLFTRAGTGSIFDPHSQSHAIVSTWLTLDPWLLASALALSPIALVRRSTRGIVVAFLTQVVMIVRPGYLPNMYVIGLLPFAALIVSGSLESAWRWLPGAKSSTAVWAMRGAIAALILGALLVVAPRWARTDKAATTVRVDGGARAAEQWLVKHVARNQRVIVDDQYWIYLVEHGFDHHPVRGGFFSRTVVSYWPLDYDPAVKRYFPHGWRDFNYIVSTQAIRVTMTQTPTAAAAIDHSRVVASFGQGLQRVEIRAVTKPGR